MSFVNNKTQEGLIELKETVRNRILRTSKKLFYRQGVNSTGINQIIEEAEVAKASFYMHFPSKRDLILECITEYDKTIKNQMVGVVLDSISFNDFVKKWIIAMKRNFQIIYRGCPITEFGFQIDSSDSEMMELLSSIIHGWENLVSEFLEKMIKNDKLPGNLDVARVSRQLVYLYEGAATMWRITNDETYIDDLEYLMPSMLR